MRSQPYESRLRRSGVVHIAGLDEVGRGALFGPVLAAAAVLRPKARVPGLDDSKRLSAVQRAEVFEVLQRATLDWAVGIVSAAEIDRINILRATRLAMRRAIGGLRRRPDHLLVDALELDIDIPQTSIVKGDSRCRSIAAASVLAKCVRDHLMGEYARGVRGYGLGQNMGYGTRRHREAIMSLGFSEFHRRTFRVQGELPFESATGATARASADRRSGAAVST